MTSPIGGPGQRGRIGLDIGSIGERGALRPAQPQGVDGGSFADTLRQAVEGVSDKQDVAQDYVGKFLRGDNVELHQVMAATEEAQLSLEMLIELRNKFTEAYRTVINMQA